MQTAEGHRGTLHYDGGPLPPTWTLSPTWCVGFSRTDRCIERGSSLTGVLHSMLFRVQGCLLADMMLLKALPGMDSTSDGPLIQMMGQSLTSLTASQVS